jgi:hypothetical protein
VNFDWRVVAVSTPARTLIPPCYDLRGDGVRVA